jgi:virulence-associated protein VagC
MLLFGMRFESKSMRRRGLLKSKNPGDDFFKNGPRVSDDFMTEREQPPAEERERHIEATD